MKTTILFFISTFLFLSLGISEVFGEFDLRYEGFVRPYPIGGFLRADIGYGQKIWGSNKNYSPLYGMIRPHVQFQTSGVINSTRGFLEFHPISFWSFYIGKEYTYRKTKALANFDCDQHYCDIGGFERNHWGTNLAMKVKRVFYMGRLQWQTTRLDENPYRYFVDEQGTLLGLGTKDTLFYQTHILGLELNKIQSLALLYKQNEMRNTHFKTSMGMFLYRHLFIDPFHPEKGRNFALSAGPGFFRTQQRSTHPSFILSIMYNWKKGLTLF